MLDGMHLILQTDGGSRGNPGPAAWGFVLYDEQGTLVEGRGGYMGTATNNNAEYQAVIEGMTTAKKLGATRVSLQADSELAIRQLQGRYKVKHPEMQRLVAEVRALANHFDEVTFEHIRREQNAAADALVNQALDEAGHKKVPFDFKARFRKP